MSRWVRLVAVASLLASAMSCREGLLFRDDHRVKLLAPVNNAEVHQPLTIRWTARDFDPRTDGSYAVFVDRDPMPPGESIEYFSLLSRASGIFVLKQRHLDIDVFTKRDGVDEAEQNHHDVTVVLLGADGRRIGESAAFSEFRVLD